MKTTFAKLAIGERFHSSVDADGPEPYSYKISDTEAYVESGYGAGFRETIASDAGVWAWGNPVILHSAPTEIERTALIILMGGHSGQPRADHIGLKEYIVGLATDVDEMRSLDLYIWEKVVILDGGEEIPLHEFCQQRGYVCRQKLYDRDRDAFGPIPDHAPRDVTGEERLLSIVDDAAARLSSAIADYRTAGRPEGEQIHTISGMGNPLLRVVTPLAAAVAEYHERMLDLYANANEQIHLEGLLTPT